MSLKIIPTGAALGAEISGVDLAHDIDAATFEQLRRAFHQYEVVFFRGHEVSDDDHIRLSERFGELRRLKEHRTQRFYRSELIVISNIMEDGRYIGGYDSGLFWHTDGAHMEQPFAASLLHAVEVPQKGGRTLGDTRFASMTAAYDALPAAMKKRLQGLQAVQSLLLRDEKSVQAGRQRAELSTQKKNNSQAVHPVVRPHPVTGRMCLYVSEGYTERILGMPQDESDDLLAELTTHCVQPRFVYTHNWRVHDLVVWDDCSTQHKATFDYALPLRRLMYRSTVTRFA